MPPCCLNPIGFGAKPTFFLRHLSPDCGCVPQAHSFHNHSCSLRTTNTLLLAQHSMDAVHDDLVSLIFYRRHNIQRTAREVNKRRRSDLKDYSFPDIVFIATFGGLSDIPKYNPALVQQARIRNKEFSFFDYWQKYCKALLDPERTLAIYGETGGDTKPHSLRSNYG